MEQWGLRKGLKTTVSPSWLEKDETEDAGGRLEVRERTDGRKRALKVRSGIWPSVAGKEEPLRGLEETGGTSTPISECYGDEQAPRVWQRYESSEGRRGVRGERRS